MQRTVPQRVVGHERGDLIAQLAPVIADLPTDEPLTPPRTATPISGDARRCRTQTTDDRVQPPFHRMQHRRGDSARMTENATSHTRLRICQVHAAATRARTGQVHAGDRIAPAQPTRGRATGGPRVERCGDVGATRDSGSQV